MERRYLALVRGEPRTDRGEVDAPISEEWEGGRRRVAHDDEEAREALTLWRVRELAAAAAAALAASIRLKKKQVI